MPASGFISPPARSDPTVRAIARAWRRLTGGTQRGTDRARRTLIACSGGGDSSGLVLSLAAALSDPSETLVVAHIVHDMRPESHALADRDSARELAAALGLPFVEGTAAVRAIPANAEATARRLRYRALVALARGNGCPYIATAHHAQDQLETILMALIRGSGPRGLAGAAVKRRLGPSGPMLIRPALGVTRDELLRMCHESGWTWREDATNTDLSRLRAAIRHGIAPELERLRPGVAARAAQTAGLMRDVASLLESGSKRLLAASEPLRNADGDPVGFLWPRETLRAEHPILIGSMLKAAASRLRARKGKDQLGSASLRPATRAIRSRSPAPRRFQWSGILVCVTSRTVEIRSEHLA